VGTAAPAGVDLPTCGAVTGWYHGEEYVCAEPVDGCGVHDGDHRDRRYGERVRWPNRERDPMNTGDTWWHVARTPTGIRVHQLDRQAWAAAADALGMADPSLAAATIAGDWAQQIRDSLGFPTLWGPGGDEHWLSCLHRNLPRDATAEDVVIGKWPPDVLSDR
jgi:hypothetical protein